MPICADILNAWIDATDWMPRMHPPEDVQRHYRDFVFKNRDTFVSDGPVLGYVSLDADNYVTALYASVPGQGVGQRLLAHAKSLRPSLRLWTFVANRDARRFYEREGFVETDRTDGDNEEKLPDVLYQWSRA
jgi:GNAT superfamily N-acetyltransferase